MQWSEYTTFERLKSLRGGMTQEQLAEAAAVSVGVVRKLERGGTASLPSLLSIADALGTDIAVLLGQQAPRRSMDRDERAALRMVSAATHDAAIGIPADVEPGSVEELRSVVRRADAAYWAGRYTELGTLLGQLLPEARARFDAADPAEREAAGGVLIDTFQTAGMAANVLGSRDLAYAALTYGRQIAVQAGDDLRDAHLAATTAWVNLRDGRTTQGFALAAAQADRIEPKMSEHDPDRLSVYGQLVTNAAVAASRGGAGADSAREYLSQAHAVAARIGEEHARGAHAQPYGPMYAATQAMSIAVALGDTSGALRLMDTVRLDDSVPLATRARYGLDVALTHVECRRWEAAADTLEAVCTMAPGWVRHQMLPGVIIGRLAGVSVGRLRGLANAAGVPLGVR
ncbi:MULTISPECIES: helix-turn-helix domain-containing protein [unclassified Streptomyces]|uniref:helix-turn-helix domain-containing protein n=1 Tax=unclassified Streptomyces TaxID=2593676 RepID=UPI001BE55499|nr:MULTISPECIES: helix-turn-helix transcriptional regulator [unclassified Streptomyces]MBT2407950.1 helix-turn-helix transcriptional regulator [Streptomyces sp. ISL-21]MBT2610555.1 helix-turn-helix transcriptional regulator [Streptomyces sp. ISL-87]